jgi:LacI family transcriptional regulator
MTSSPLIISDMNAPPKNRIRLVDIAAEAGVSVPTVDRVLNKRGKVKPETARHVLRIVEQLQYVPNGNASRLAKGSVISFCAALPNSKAEFFEKLEREFDRQRKRFLQQGITISFRAFEDRDPNAVVQFFAETAPLFDGVAVIAMDHPLVLEAVGRYCASGGRVVCMVSDLARSSRHAFVGIDNRSAGKTAASLIGRFSRVTKGKVAVFSGPLQQMDHQERVLGFRSVLAQDFPGLSICEVNDHVLTDDDYYRVTARVLNECRDVCGIYDSGSELDPIIQAIAKSGRKNEIVLVGHELTDNTRVFLANGSADAILNQNTEFIVDRTLHTLSALCSNEFSSDQVQQLAPVEVYLRDNLPARER